ncbi:MAG: T9SS type A sorting domain-containing protein [Lewinellaceae bacterium]|nr:T9SS type A sorting domain-containing protein [Phaeodactylibacter sp.]MCB9038321.1 T9SS type A sorting domain-containing protein [Lewinellaceae bacterium]
MKIIATLIAILFVVVGTLSAQVVVINSPAELEGPYEFGTADGWGADLTTDIWTGDAEFIDDGTANPNLGCEAAINDLTGKIALIDRGTCNFSLKALNSQNAGAIAAIIINNTAGAGVQGMGAGDFGPDVTIPAVMLSFEVGQDIRAALENGPVNISIGNIIFDNNVSYADTSIVNPPYGIVPLSQLDGLGFSFNLGASVNNTGLNNATGVGITGKIEYTPFGGGAPVEVYNESGTFDGVLEPDSVSSLIILPEFTPANGMGQYTLNYTVNTDAEDQLPFDNEISTTFTINESLMSKAQWDEANNAPARTSTFYTVSGGGDVEFLSPIHIPNGEGYMIDTIIFHVLKTTPNLADVSVDGYIYEWDDANQDTSITNDEISIVGIAPFSFGAEETAQAAIVRAPILDFETFEEGVEIPANNKYYILGCRYTGPDQVYFGFDESYDFNQYENIKLSNGTFTDLDYNYLVVNVYNELVPDIEGDAARFNNVSGPVSIGIILTPPEPNAAEEVVGEEVFKMELFPNPVVEQLNTTINFKQATSFVEYQITDASGRVLFRVRDNDVMDKEQANFNVKALPSGQYFMTVRTEQGIQSSPFVVKH